MKSECEHATRLFSGPLIHSTLTHWQCPVLWPPVSHGEWGTWLARDKAKGCKRSTGSLLGIKKRNSDSAQNGFWRNG